jgi:hypothetical protein
VEILEQQDPLIEYFENSTIQKRCSEIERGQLKLMDLIKSQTTTQILTRIYGSADFRHLHETLFDGYLAWVHIAEMSEGERKRAGFDTPEECKQNVLRAIDAEISRLTRYKERHTAVEAWRLKLEALRRKVPDLLAADRLNRYEASLERAIDRTLNQLERAQRLRKGQSVPPPIRLELNS